MTQPAHHVEPPRPPCRRLRAFAFDPVLSRRIETYDINVVTLRLPWEEDLLAGPIDDYIEVIDYDPASQAFYAPVDLNEPRLLAQDGLPPSEGNPQFHQQMVYAVARTTVGHFEAALGRRALWSPHVFRDGRGRLRSEFVEHLRIYPHALREANAYYSPDKKALLFGYFPASSRDPGENLPGETVFSCLSHDIVAHETAHALLDGLHRRFIEPTNPDSWALHEAFADVVALFQHFTHADVLRHQIARTCGVLENLSLLAELAYQFGQAIGHYGALRSALGSVDSETKQWIPEKPDPQRLLDASEPHARGAILVAALFEAFLTIYKRRIADLLRIASGGSGILAPGELHPELVDRLAQEASKAAGHMLNICIRALDYCPPVDVDFGDYLRALITADADLVADDRYNYRLAIIEAFRRRGIYPRDVRSLSQESLVWQAPSEREQDAFARLFGAKARLRRLIPDWGLSTSREAIYDAARESQRQLHAMLIGGGGRASAEAAHLVLDPAARQAFVRDKRTRVPKLEVHSVRPARRIGPDGQTVTDLVVEITQRRLGYYDPQLQEQVDSGQVDPSQADFYFRGGCTLLVDQQTGQVRYCIYKNIGGYEITEGHQHAEGERRLARIRRYLTGDAEPSLEATYFGDPRRAYFRRVTAGGEAGEEGIGVEPFALLHRSVAAQEMV